MNYISTLKMETGVVDHAYEPTALEIKRHEDHFKFKAGLVSTLSSRTSRTL